MKYIKRVKVQHMISNLGHPLLDTFISDGQTVIKFIQAVKLR